MHPELLVRKRMLLLTVVLLTLFALAVARVGQLTTIRSAELTRRGVSRFLLAHLSINSNFPGLAFETSAAKLRQMGALVGAGQDVMLEVMPRDEASLLWAF